MKLEAYEDGISTRELEMRKVFEIKRGKDVEMVVVRGTKRKMMVQVTCKEQGEKKRKKSIGVVDCFLGNLNVSAIYIAAEKAAD